MVRDNAAQKNFSVERGTSPANTSAPSSGVARRINVVIRSGTRANPRNEDTESAELVC